MSKPKGTISNLDREDMGDYPAGDNPGYFDHPPINTINGEVDDYLELIETAFEQGRTADACNLIQEVIAQEANKARIDELGKLLEFRTDNVTPFLVARYNRLLELRNEAQLTKENKE